MHELNLPDLAEVLAEVNCLRHGLGMKPLSEMPKGERCGLASCPLARALNVYVGSTSYMSALTATRKGATPLPWVLWRFRCAFDEGDYPELVA
jgi:hypothetical protein